MVQAAAVAAAKVVGTVVGALGASAGAVSLAFQGAFYLAQALIFAGINYGVNALTRPKTTRNLGTETDLQIDPAYPRQMLIGRRGIAGSLGPKYSYGPSNWGCSIIYVIADHPMTSLEQVFADGRLVHSTPLVHGVRTEITAYNDGEAHMFMTWHDGRPGQTADAQLIAASAGDPDVVAGKIGAWTSNHRGEGVAYVHVEMVFHPDYLVTPPKFVFDCKGAPLYDRRLDSTAGGSGSHRLDDPSTWAYTDNVAVALDHYLLGYKVEDDDRAFGIGLRPSEVPYATFAAAADLADEDVSTGTWPGIEVIKRYRANGTIGAERYFEDVVAELQVQMAARVVDLGGTVGILGAEARTPVVALTDQDLVNEETVEFAPKLGFADLVGAVEGVFADPAQLWEYDSYQPQYAEEYQLPDGGELDTLTLALPFETHPRRAVRLARAHLNREQLQARLVASFMPKAWELEVGDWFTYSDDYLQLVDAEFEVIDIIKHADFSVTLTARATDPDFVAFSVDDDPDLSVPPDFAPLDLALDAPTFLVTAQAIAGGSSTKPAFRLALLSADVLTQTISIEYRTWIASTLGDESLTLTMRPDQIYAMAQAGVLPGVQYKFRVKADAGGKSSGWSDWSTAVTAGASDNIGGTAAAIVGQGALALADWAQLGATVRLEDGSTIATDALLRTILGVAAGITGQGALATNDFAKLGTTVRLENGTTVATNALLQTALGIAAGIAGQGWGATANEASASNSFVPVGVNLLYDTNFRILSGYWTIATTSADTRATETFDDLRVRLCVLTGTPGYNNQIMHANSTDRMVPVAPGQRLAASALIGCRGCHSAELRILWRDSAKVNFLDSVLQTITPSQGGGYIENYDTVKGIATAPTGARYAQIFVRGFTDGVTSSPHVRFARPLLALVRSDANSVPEWSIGFDGQSGADVTAGGTAAGVAGQGNFATTNFYRQSTAPSAAEGVWWVDTASGQLKLYTGGAWQVIADIAGGLTASLSTNQATASVHSGYVESPTVTVTPGGATTYHYFWEHIHGDSFSIHNPNSASTKFSTTVSAGQAKDGYYKCTVRDVATGRTTSVIVRVYLYSHA